MSKTRCTYIAYDTGITLIAQGSRPRVMTEARRHYRRLKNRGEIGKPARGTWGRPVFVSVVESCGKSHTRTIWKNGRKV